MRVLHVIPSISPVHGGPSYAIEVMTRALIRKGVDVTIATTNDDGPGRISQRGSVAPGDAARYCARKWLETYKVAPGLVPWLWREVPTFDVVHIHALFSFSSTVAGWIAARRSVPFVVRPLGTLTSYAMHARKRQVKRLSMALNEGSLLRRAAAVHFTSDLERREADDLQLTIRAAVIPLGVEPVATGVRDRLVARHPQVAGKRVVLFLSRLDPKKNLEALIDAITTVASRAPDVCLLIAGRGEPIYEQSLRARAAALGERIVWAGHLSGADKADAFAAADVFVLPSQSENFGIAAVEAMTAGLACILGINVGDAARLADEGAIVAIEPDPRQLADVIIALLGDDGGRARLGERARTVAARDFSADAMADRLIALYRGIAPVRRR